MDDLAYALQAQRELDAQQQQNWQSPSSSQSQSRPARGVRPDEVG
jgi:hypothetical protein